jgi:adenylosuccinate lyase
MIGTHIDFVLSGDLLAGYRRVLLLPKVRRRHGLSAQQIDVILLRLAENAIVRERPRSPTSAPDPGDQHLWDLPEATTGAVLVSGDARLLSALPAGRSVLGAKAFVEGCLRIPASPPWPPADLPTRLRASRRPLALEETVIPRYTRPEMAACWSEENRLRVLLEIELLACEAMAELGEVPAASARVCRERAASIDIAALPGRVAELEATLKHDVIAFLTAVNEHIGPDSRFLHMGMTSSDILDTASGVQWQQAGALLLSELDRALQIVKRRAADTKDMPCIGRTHGIHAEPMTFGLKLAGWYDDLRRARRRLATALADVSVGAISGAVGTYAFVDPRVEVHVCRALGIAPAAITHQVVSRDRHAAVFAALALLGSCIERCAVEIRHLQRTEVQEAEEAFGKGQKGSSAMPHKRNPIGSENLTGLARLLRGYAVPAEENVALWHERDISHSSVERVIAPDACIVAHTMIGRFADLVEGLVVYPENMLRNMDRLGGVHFSGRIMLCLVSHGLTRETAYAAVQRNAMAVWAEGGTLRDRLAVDAEIADKLPRAALDAAFDLEPYLRHRDAIFARVFADDGGNA